MVKTFITIMLVAVAIFEGIAQVQADDIPKEMEECLIDMKPVLKRFMGYYDECALSRGKRSASDSSSASASTEEVYSADSIETSDCFINARLKDTAGIAQIMTCVELMAELPEGPQMSAVKKFRKLAFDAKNRKF